MDWIDLTRTGELGYYENGNAYLVATKCREFFAQLRNYFVAKKDYATWSCLFVSYVP